MCGTRGVAGHFKVWRAPTFGHLEDRYSNLAWNCGLTTSRRLCSLKPTVCDANAFWMNWHFWRCEWIFSKVPVADSIIHCGRKLPFSLFPVSPYLGRVCPPRDIYVRNTLCWQEWCTLNPPQYLEFFVFNVLFFSF